MNGLLETAVEQFTSAGTVTSTKGGIFFRDMSGESAEIGDPKDGESPFDVPVAGGCPSTHDPCNKVSGQAFCLAC